MASTIGQSEKPQFTYQREAMEMILSLPVPALTAGASSARALVAMSDPESSDAELIQRIGDGDREAFESLYERYARPVFGFALRRLRDRGQAEDVAQETFASVWRSASSYRPERGPGAAWLYAVARNAVVDRIRINARANPNVPAEPASEEGPEEHAQTDWLAWRVHRAFGELPETERAVLELAYWGGLSQSEIADFLGIPLGTVKTRTRSGLARMADLLEGEDLRG
jgi:RNA polymerase sigma-70 factor (ECF subfamily)